MRVQVVHRQQTTVHIDIYIQRRVSSMELGRVVDGIKRLVVDGVGVARSPQVWRFDCGRITTVQEREAFRINRLRAFGAGKAVALVGGMTHLLKAATDKIVVWSQCVGHCPDDEDANAGWLPQVS